MYVYMYVCMYHCAKFSVILVGESLNILHVSVTFYCNANFRYYCVLFWHKISFFKTFKIILKRIFVGSSNIPKYS